MRIVTLVCDNCHGYDSNCPECQGSGHIQIAMREDRTSWIEYVVGAAWIAGLAAFCWACWRIWHT
jgi:hypothetical protein